jgi:glycosyltransferase involved in cell wall biosynthesis
MGGAEAVLLDILADLRNTRPEWQLELIVGEAGPLLAQAHALGVATHLLSFPVSLARLGDSSLRGAAASNTSWLLFRELLFASNSVRSYVSSLRRKLRELAPDVIHTNGFKMHILAALAKPKQTPLIWHVHDYVSSRALMARLMKLFRKRCRLALANSNSVAADIKAACGESLPVHTVYNAIDTEVFSPQGDQLDLDSLSGLPTAGPGTIRVGMIATCARWKGHEVFLNALSLVPAEVPLRGYIIGDALYQTDGSQYSLAELKAHARQLGIADRVGFTGFVEQPAAAMRSLEIVVHASTAPEPFGLVIIEGMACGRAVIASEAGGAAELFEPGRTALGHPPGDVAQLAACITQLANDPDLRARLGQAGRAVVAQRFDRRRLATDLIPIYESVANYQNVANFESLAGAAR